MIGWISYDDGCYYCDGYTFTLFDLNCSSFPVELISFGGEVSEKEVILRWQTATEQNNYGFEIERSVAQISNLRHEWEKIGFVEGNGNSNSPKDYTFVDSQTFELCQNLEGFDGKIQYRLKQIDTDGTFEYSEIVEVEIELQLPTKFELFQNYPNPFNPSTTIKFGLPKDSQVSLEIFNILGEKVATLIDKEMPAGYHNFQFSTSFIKNS
ncbi:MAG: hypothetical protein KF721_14230 [Ignavibacteriaceae bacterium]|nr:hypothetical protein [Ignavibacteriaceae bacterium]